MRRSFYNQRESQTQTPIFLFRGHPCKLFNSGGITHLPFRHIHGGEGRQFRQAHSLAFGHKVPDYRLDADEHSLRLRLRTLVFVSKPSDKIGERDGFGHDIPFDMRSVVRLTPQEEDSGRHRQSLPFRTLLRNGPPSEFRRARCQDIFVYPLILPDLSRSISPLLSSPAMASRNDAPNCSSFAAPTPFTCMNSAFDFGRRCTIPHCPSNLPILTSNLNKNT